VIVTTNLDPGEWASALGDAQMTTVLLDHLTHRCHIVPTGNESHRYWHSSLGAGQRVKAREATRKRGQSAGPISLEVVSAHIAINLARQ